MDLQKWVNEIEAEVAQAALNFVQSDSAALEQELAPYVAQGEVAVVNAAKKISPIAGFVVQEAVNYLGKDVPAFEGDAVKYIEAVLEAFIAKKQGS